jgi:hypothetical protein
MYEVELYLFLPLLTPLLCGWAIPLMECTDSIMNSKVGYLLLFVIMSQLTKPSPFTSLWGGFVSLDFTFMIMLGSKEIAIIYSLPSQEPSILHS